MIKHETLLFLFGTAVVSGMVLRPEIKPQPILVAPNDYMPSLGYWSDIPSPVVGFSSGWKSIILNEAFKNNNYQLKVKVPCSKKPDHSPEIKAVQVPIAPISLPEPLSVEDLKPIPIEQFLTPVNIPEGPVLPPFSISDLSSIQRKDIFPANSDLEHDIGAHIAKDTELPQTLLEEQEDISVQSQIADEKAKEEFWNLVEIPKAPELPPFTTPEIPVAEEVEKLVPEPNKLDESETYHHKSTPTALQFLPAKKEELYNLESKEDYFKLVDIPNAPELPPFSMPVIPAIEPETSELPKFTDLSRLELPLVKWYPADVESYHTPDPAIHKEPCETIISKEAPKLFPSVIPELPVKVVLELTPEIKQGEFFKGSPSEWLPSPLPESIEEDYLEHVKIPEAPELPPFSMPAIPESKEIFSNIPESVPSLPAFIPASIQNNQEPGFLIKEESSKLIDLPKAPELPPFSMPSLPVDIEVSHYSENEPSKSHKDFEILSLPESKIEEEFIMPAVIPKAPELPPFEMSAIPKSVKLFTNIPESPPSLPAFIPASIENLHVPRLIIKDESHKLTDLPKAPELPPFSMPIVPVYVEVGYPSDNEPCESPKDFKLPLLPESKTEEEFIIPAVIPKAPELPPYSMPEIPDFMQIDEEIEEMPMPLINAAELINLPEPPSLFMHERIPSTASSPESENKEDYIEMEALPKPPQLPSFSLAELPSIEETHKIILDQSPEMEFVNHIDLPTAPELPEIPKVILEESCEEEESSPQLGSDISPVETIAIPEPSILTSFEMPKLNDLIWDHPQISKETQKVVEMKEFKPIFDAPELPPFYRFAGMKVPFVNEKYDMFDNIIPSGPEFTSACVQNIISERVLPKMVLGYPNVPVFTYV